MNRQFRYSGATNAQLGKNAQHDNALRHTLKIFRSNAAYTFIPKNACSTMRFSLALANGCITDAAQADWIHNNNETFAVTTESAYLASFTFVILRCPFRRLYSIYMDKLVNMDLQAWRLHNNSGRNVHPHDLTFQDFVELLQDRKVIRSDHHWWPQTDFLLYRDYDAYYALERFDGCIRDLKAQIDFNVQDARDFIGHSTHTYAKVETGGPYHRASAFDILCMKKDGKLPAEKTMFTDEIIAAVSKLYRNDIELYKSLFGADMLLFDSSS